MAHQSLYRRYRPRRFAELRGQDHIVGALRNAVAHQSEGHAYLFSGPRGTGKTSTARILAKALNCDNLDAGELMLGVRNSAGDTVAHFAHLGGAIAGFLLVYYWNKKKRRTFYR